MSTETALHALAHAVGLASHYDTIDGTRQSVPEESLRAIVAALGHDADDPAQTLAQLQSERASRLCAPALASFEPQPPRVTLNPEALDADTIEWSLTGDDQVMQGTCAVDDLDRDNDAVRLALPALAPGYYRLTLRAGKRHTRALLVRAQAKAWMAHEPDQACALAIQLYEQVGPDSIGIGDFSDLAGIGAMAARMGIATVGTNPLHAPFLTEPTRASPYSPSSRLALNPLYLDVRRLPGMDAALNARLAAPDVAAHVRALNAQPRVDYAAVSKLKLSIARQAYANFQAAGGDIGFDQFCREANAGMREWAAFETVAAVNGANAHAWPAPLKNREGRALDAFLAEHASMHEFCLWLQWQAEVQLTAASERAGLAMGLYHDLALGADAAGAEVWAGGNDYVTTLGVGAPPDPLNPGGQSWGFPPFDPSQLQQRELAPFIELVRANMRHAGVLRFDHVLGLNRLFVIPSGGRAADGAYLYYPLHLLLAVLVLESHRAQCVVVGEDLGTVPAGLRERLAERGILSLRLLYFEHGPTGQPRKPRDYPRDALASVGSHDLPPLAGWWREDDLDRNDRLRLWPSAQAGAEARKSRLVQRTALAEALREADVPGSGDEPPAVATYRWLARTPSRLVSVQPEDALGIVTPVNVPGTTDEEPNWRRRRLPSWPEWMADPRFIAVMRALQAERGTPSARTAPAWIATCRLQLNKAFGFADAAACAPYLARLGVSHLYLSPIMASVPGSSHGYDMCDPAVLDPERGGEAGFAELRAAAQAHGLGLVVDFVPNHMAAHAADPWWMDLLEWGHASVCDATFDVDWSAEDGRLILPLLGAPLEEVLENDEITLVMAPTGRVCARYYANQLPLAPETLGAVLRLTARRLADRPLTILARRLHALGRVSDSERRAAGLRIQAQLAAHVADNGGIDRLNERLTKVARETNALGRLLAAQHWHLMYWQRGSEEINYRRFFDINDLAALYMERPSVFGAAHIGIHRLLAADAVDGVRLDHVDGLAAPGRYLQALDDLARATGSGARLWVEKILAVDEPLRPWPVAGTTGYEFLNDVTRFFITHDGAGQLQALWRVVNPQASDFTHTLLKAKREIIDASFAAMLERIVRALSPRAPIAPETLADALRDFVVALPIYRGYADRLAPTHDADEAMITTALAAVEDPTARDWLATLVTASQQDFKRLPPDLRDGITRLWQLASAAMAKGMEDTAFYRDFALLALNEVGGDPRVASLAADRLHARMAVRARDWPLALNASATHDTKRGEDARMRLAMLPALAREWTALVPRLRAAAQPLRLRELHPADEYFIWQTLLALWPPPAADAPADGERERLAGRLGAYLIKALREGKLRSSWLAPDEAYENAAVDYAQALLDPVRAQPFQQLFLPFATQAARLGALASLAALTLKCTAPGIPDIYQGAECWDLSLVDPDNRRPVDYAQRERLLTECDLAAGVSRGVHAGQLLETWPDGRIKMYLLERLLHLRQRHAEVFVHGAYEPVAVHGGRADAVLAFQRAHHGQRIVVLVARIAPGLVADERCALRGECWGDTTCDPQAQSDWVEWLTGRRFARGPLVLSELLDGLPAAVLIAEGRDGTP